jgi:hypothetical protein
MTRSSLVPPRPRPAAPALRPGRALRSTLAVLGAALGAFGLAPPPSRGAASPPASDASRSPASDPKAVAVAERVMDALGGEAAWKRTRFLRFDFAVDRGGKTLMRRAHTWDKWTGRYRVEAKDEQGRPVVVLVNLGTGKGRAWVNGDPVEGKALAKRLEAAFAWWTNDMYWLLMPYKMRDPGVHLAWVGEKTKDGTTWDEVALTFDYVGLTPKDRYWVFVNHKTGFVDRWEFVLQGHKPPPVLFEWKGWKEYSGIWLADDRVSPKDGTRIHFPVLDVPSSVADEVFDRP